MGESGNSVVFVVKRRNHHRGHRDHGEGEKTLRVGKEFFVIARSNGDEAIQSYIFLDCRAPFSRSQ